MADLLTVKQAAKELGYHPNHLRRLLRRGVIHGRKLRNGRWVITRREVERVKDRQTERGRYMPTAW